MEKKAEKISLSVRFETPPEKEIPLLVFLFTRGGKLVQREAVKNNEVVLKNPGIDPRELRVFIAPASDQRTRQVRTISELESFKPYEAILTRETEGKFSILPIPDAISKWWPICLCRVTGSVTKWFNMDNIWQDRPICQARVHICDIDAILFWIFKIPDYIIARIPDIVLKPVPFPHPPIPDPGPYRGITLPAVQTPDVEEVFLTTSLEKQQADMAQKLPVPDADIRQKLANGNLNEIRETIASNFAVFHPYFCLFPWLWPYFYRCDELSVVYTDVNGRFDTNVWYWCTGDHPDIYIWIECMINGVWTTMYKPPIPCYTYWNYACGTDVHVHITDPRVQWGCNEVIPGEIVWVKTIGTGTSVSHINQNPFLVQPPPGQSVSYNRIGLTDAHAIYDPGFLPTSVGDYKRPFGGNLTFLLQFSSGLPSAGIYYYRWSYKKVANADLSPASDIYHALTNTVYKGYTFEYLDAMNVKHFGSNSVKLGPVPAGSYNDLYIIPPVNPAMAPFSVTESSPFWDQNTYSITFDSSSLADGLYEFKLELFDKNGSLLSGIAKTTFQVPDYSSFAPSVNAPDALLENPVAATADAYKMLMRIDNGQCDADIFTVKVNGVESASDCCGFVSYKPNNVEASIGLSFLAAQPNNFAVFSFGVKRGTCTDNNLTGIAGASGMVIDSANGYARGSSSIYDKSFTPLQLLGTCYDAGTGKAAFAETLWVAAMATDGTYRLQGNDRSKVAAFALEP